MRGSRHVATRSSLEVAVCFRGHVVKYFPQIGNGCVYVLSQQEQDLELPSWAVLKRNRCLIVKETMRVELVEVCDSDGVMDVADLVKQLLLPPFKTINQAAFVSSQR